MVSSHLIDSVVICRPPIRVSIVESLAEWQKRFDAYLNAKPGGKAQWSRLVFGANPALLMLMSAEITANSPQGLELHRDELRAFRKELKVRIAKVLATAGLVETLNAQVSSRHADLTQFAELPQMLRDYAHYLDGYAKAASKLSSKRLPGTSNYSLFFLHSYLVRL